MVNAWFRFYHEFDSDPKVQMMPEAMQRRLVMLFCSQCKHETLHETERAFHWRISATELAETKAVFIEKGFIDEQWNLLNWERRQFLSDNSTDRVRRYRQAQKQGETLHETDNSENSVSRNAVDTDTEQKQNRTETTKAAKKRPSPFVLPDWISKEVWSDFEEMRKAQRAPLTDKARANIVAALVKLEAAGQQAEDVLNQSITNSWRGVFPIKTDGGSNGRGGGSYGNRGQARTNGNLEALKASLEGSMQSDFDRTGGGPASIRERGDVEAVQRPSV